MNDPTIGRIELLNRYDRALAYARHIAGQLRDVRRSIASLTESKGELELELKRANEIVIERREKYEQWYALKEEPPDDGKPDDGSAPPPPDDT